MFNCTQSAIVIDLKSIRYTKQIYMIQSTNIHIKIKSTNVPTQESQCATAHAQTCCWSLLSRGRRTYLNRFKSTLFSFTTCICIVSSKYSTCFESIIPPQLPLHLILRKVWPQRRVHCHSHISWKYNNFTISLCKHS